jgi:hypothetical protein
VIKFPAQEYKQADGNATATLPILMLVTSEVGLKSNNIIGN